MSYIGIAIGGTKTAVTVSKKERQGWTILKKDSFPTHRDDDKETIHDIFKRLDDTKDIEGISIIIGGPLNYKKGLVQKPPHLPGFDGTPIVDVFKKRYNVPVILTNDADACALAEYLFGDHGDAKDLIYFTFGTGFGAGLILDGKLHRGNLGMAGEIGHLRLTKAGPKGYGRAGSVEGYLAGGNIPSLIERYKDDYPESICLKNERPTTKDIFDAARENDSLALKIVGVVAEKLGETCAIVIDMLNPDVIAIGGIYPRCKDLLEKATLKAAKKNSIPQNFASCRIVVSTLGESIDEYSSIAPLMEERK